MQFHIEISVVRPSAMLMLLFYRIQGAWAPSRKQQILSRTSPQSGKFLSASLALLRSFSRNSPVRQMHIPPNDTEQPKPKYGFYQCCMVWRQLITSLKSCNYKLFEHTAKSYPCSRNATSLLYFMACRKMSCWTPTENV